MTSAVPLSRQAALVDVGSQLSWTMWSYIDRTGHRGLKSTTIEDIEPGMKAAASTIRLVADLGAAIGDDERALAWLNRAIDRARNAGDAA